MSEEMEMSAGEVEYVDSEKIVAHILIDPSSAAEMDVSTHNSVVTTIAQSIIEQNPSLQLDANAYSLLEQTIAETMAGNTQNIAIDTGSALVPMEITIGHPTEEDINAVPDEVTVPSDDPKKNYTIPSSSTSQTSSRSLHVEELSAPYSFAQRTGAAKNKAHICEICGKAFGVKGSLTKHMQIFHGSDRMKYFSCALCGSTFKLHKNWIKHMKKVHAMKCADPESNLYVPDEEGTDTYTGACKSKNCIRRKTNLKHQGHQTGCDCVPPKNRCMFCKPEKHMPLRVDDSECSCFEPYFVREKTFSEAATGTGCEKVDCIECELCPKFEKPVPTTSGTGIQCIECNITFSRVTQLRCHLKLVHGHKTDYQILKLPDMNAFKKWKYELERREMSCYIKQHGSKKLKSGLIHFYSCHRSGRYYRGQQSKPNNKMMDRKAGSWKLGIQCTATIYCIETPGSGVVIKYWPEHYGHGKDTSFVQISPEEHAAIQDSVAKGVSVDTFLDDIRDHQAEYDQSQLFLMKKKDIKYITSSYTSFDFNNGLSDAESTDLWIRTICQMEDSPVLFYKQELDHEEFLLIIMTEFQKQIFLAADKEVICVDSLDRKKGNRFHFTVLTVMDECNIAFPVAFCISNKLTKEIALQFFVSIRESTGAVDCTYFMSDQKSFYYEAWVEVMGGEPRWLWCLWYMQNEIKLQLRTYKTPRRVDVYNILKVLMDCQNETIFQTIYEKYINELPSDQLSQNLGAFVQKYYENAKLWAQCYRKSFKPNVSMHLEALHYAFRFCCQERSKRRLDKFLLVVMKLVRRKMLDRLSKVLDEENIKIALQAISTYHNLGLEIPAESITSLSDKIWLIQTEEEGDVYVSCDVDMCPEDCALKCEQCDVCVHMYSCTCSCSLINANLCHHIHAVAWKFLVPHFSPPPSPGADPYEEMPVPEDRPPKAAELVDQVLSRAHEVYKKVRDKKNAMNRDVLNCILDKLNSCITICDKLNGQTLLIGENGETLYMPT